MNEIWKPIPSEPGYEASSFGRVRSLDRDVSCVIKGKACTRKSVSRIRKPIDNGSGYLHLHITRSRHRYVHRLVAEAFLGAAPRGKPWVCHNDGNPKNNRPENLRYDSAKGNEADKKKHGTRRPERSHFAVLTPLHIRAIKELHLKFSQSELATLFGVTQPTISRVVTGFCWSDAEGGATT